MIWVCFIFFLRDFGSFAYDFLSFKSNIHMQLCVMDNRFEDLDAFDMLKCNNTK